MGKFLGVSLAFLGFLSLWNPVELLAQVEVKPYAGVSSTAVSRSTGPLPVAVDQRIELLSIVFRLIDSGEFNMPVSQSPYSQAVESHFAAYKSHPTLQMAAALREEREIGFDAVISFAVHLEDIHSGKFVVSLDPLPNTLDARWTANSAREFAKALVNFVEESKFDEFWDKQKERRSIAEDRMRDALSRRPYREWIESFFGKSISSDSSVMVAMLAGGGNYGVSVANQNKVSVFPTIGCSYWDGDGHPVFPDSVADTIIHEFCHPYVNPIVDEHFDTMQSAGDWLIKLRGKTMQAQAYESAKTVLYESLVRGCVVQILSIGLGQEAGTAQQKKEISRGFLLTEAIVRSLERYSSERAQFPNLNAYFEKLAQDLADATRNGLEIEARVPVIVSILPRPGEKDVGNEVEFCIEFDRPMDTTSRGLNLGDAKFERVVPGNFDESGRIYKTTLRFEVGTHVHWWINRFNMGLTTPSGFAASEVELDFQIGSKESKR